MQFDLKLDSQTRAVLMAMGGGTVAAVAAMFVPVGIWEMITGSTGISEMIPATAAPLGDTARAMIAFTCGVLAFATLSVTLLKRAKGPKAAPVIEAAPIVYETAVEDAEAEEAPSMVAKLKNRMSSFVDNRRDEEAIADLEDLPKLRSGDAHPDAPPRRPLLVTRDLADEEALPEAAQEIVEAEIEEVVIADDVADAETVEIVETTVVEEVIEAEVEPTAVAPIAESEPAPAMSLATLAETIDRLERALTERDAKLVELEALVAESAAPSQTPDEPSPAQPVANAPAPTLEAVPAPAAALDEAEEMDAALRSALETLHRMNARTR
jgi:hypothetical protein